MVQCIKIHRMNSYNRIEAAFGWKLMWPQSTYRALQGATAREQRYQSEQVLSLHNSSLVFTCRWREEGRKKFCSLNFSKCQVFLLNKSSLKQHEVLFELLKEKQLLIFWFSLTPYMSHCWFVRCIIIRALASESIRPAVLYSYD